jgi:hypothetical protein
MAATYRVRRCYFNKPGVWRTIKAGITLEQAQAHCSDPETSSSTCKGKVGKARTRKLGPWFDCYTEDK